MCYYIRVNILLTASFCLQGAIMGKFQYSGERVSLSLRGTVCGVDQCYIPDLKLKGHTQQYCVDPYLHDVGVRRNV